MKNLKLFVLALGLFTLNVAATYANPIKPTNELQTQIVELIGDGFWSDMQSNENSATVTFTVNAKRQIVVLSVDSENEDAEDYLKEKLNYKKVDHKPTKHGEIYLLPVKMIKL